MVTVFFYGGLINPDMLERLGIAPRAQTRAVLDDFALTISPWVNVEPAPDAQVFGVLMEMSHEELAHIYGQLKVAYAPYPVLVQTPDGSRLAALCYIAGQMDHGQAEAGHVQTLLDAAEKLDFPQWYLERIRSFLPRPG